MKETKAQGEDMKDTHTSRPSDVKEDTNKITTCCINTDDNSCTKHSTVMRNVKKKKRYWRKTTKGSWRWKYRMFGY